MKKLKKLTALLAAILITATAFTSTTTVMAKEDISQNTYKSSDEASTLSSPSTIPSASVTFTDKNKNQYKVSGTCLRLNYDATLMTGFSVTKYNDTSTSGKTTVNNYTKKVSANGQVVYLLNQQTANFSTSSSKTGKSGDVRIKKTYEKYLYSVRGTHTVSCNGGSGGCITFDSIF